MVYRLVLWPTLRRQVSSLFLILAGKFLMHGIGGCPGQDADDNGFATHLRLGAATRQPRTVLHVVTQ